MKQQRITLTRETDFEMLRTKPYYQEVYEYNPDIPDFGLCDDTLREYFDVPLSCMKIDLVLSTKEHKDSYGVRRFVLDDTRDFIQVQDPVDTVWVDKELAQAIQEFALAAKQEFIYISFEFPKGC